MFDCEACREKKLYKYRGCDGHRRIGKAVEPIALDRFGREKVDYCPRLAVNRMTFKAIQLWQFYKKGFLPYKGGILNQPYKAIQWFQVIDPEVSKVEEDYNVQQ